MIVSYMTRYKTFRLLGLVVPGSGFQVPGSRFQVPGSGLQVPGSRFRAPGSRFLILREVRIIPESEFSVSLDFSAGED
jgi:hypothetical protein